MKKIRLLLVVFGLLLTVLSSGQTTLTFRMANPNLLYSGGTNYFVFDVQVKAAVAGSYLWTGQAILNFSNTSLSTSPGDWTVLNGTLLSGTYGLGSSKYNPVLKSMAGSPLKLNLAWIANSGAEETNPSNFNEVTTSYQTLVTVYAPITDLNGVAGISFDQVSMNGQEYYKLFAEPWSATYVNPNLYDPADFMTTYLGRIYANGAWTQTEGTLDWDASVNTSVWDGTPTLTGGTELMASALRVHDPATLTIPVDGKLTVSGATDVVTTNGLNILSDATGTGSLITGSATGSATAQRFMTTGAWHIVSSPLDQTIAGFLTSNSDIATKDGTSRGVMDYSPSTNAWSNPFTDITSGSVGAGKGFSMRVGETDAAVTFAGSLQAGVVSAATDAGFWNCIGNPYTSAIGIADGSGSASQFLNVNAGNFDPSYGAIYVWNKSDASNGLTGNYTVISNTAPEFVDVQQGQAFMVNAKAGVTSFSFTSAMQNHLPALALKSTENVWPTIQLEATVGEQRSSTVIAYGSGMTKGLDPTYDAGLLKGATDLLVYTSLVEDNGIPFAVQALPDNDFNGMVIPVGIDFKTGGEVVFSSTTANLPEDCNVILEDKLTKIFTDLTTNVYSATISVNASISDRFQLHNSYQTTSISSDEFDDELQAYFVTNSELRVKGNVSKQAVATLYDIQGRMVIIQDMNEVNLNIIRTPNLKTGIYILHVKDNNKLKTFKIPVKQ